MVSVSSLVSELSTALGSLVDDLNGLHAAVNHSSLTTVMGFSMQGSVPSTDIRTQMFESDNGWDTIMQDDDATAEDILVRAVALSGSIANASTRRLQTNAITNLDNHLVTHRDGMDKIKDGITMALAKLADIQLAADESAERYPLARKSAIELFTDGVALLDATFTKIKSIDVQIITTEAAVDARFDENDVLATAQDAERIALLKLKDSLVDSKAKLVKRISFSDSDSSQAKNTTPTLKVPSDLALKGRGSELITNMDAFIRKASSRFPVIKFYVHRIGHDYDPVEGTYFEPPTISDNYLGVPPSFRAEFRSESKDLYDEFQAQLHDSGLVPALSTFKHGLSKQHTAKCGKDDGVSMYFALLSLYRPSSSVFREELEAKIQASPSNFESGDPVNSIKPLRTLLTEALQLGIRVRWTIGKKIMLVLSGIPRFGSQYTLDLAKFKDSCKNPDDSAQHMLDMLAEVETTSKSLKQAHNLNWNSVRAHSGDVQIKKSIAKCNHGSIENCPFGSRCRYSHDEDTTNRSKGRPQSNRFQGLCQAFADECPDPKKKTFRGRDYCPTCFKKALENNGKIKLRNGTMAKLKKAMMTKAIKSSEKKKRKATEPVNRPAPDQATEGFTAYQTEVLKKCFAEAKRNRVDGGSDFMQAMQANAPAGPLSFKQSWEENRSNVMDRLGATNSGQQLALQAPKSTIDQFLDDKCM
jgi:hypothetical protein